MKLKSILIAHPWMGRGGSEATAMWLLQALQDDFNVSFVTAGPIDWAELNGAYGTSVDSRKISVIRAPRIPTVDGPAKLVQLQLRYFERFCHRISEGFDICASAYNPIDFGRPAIQLMGDFSFSEEMRKRLYIHGEGQFRHRESFFRAIYLKLSEWLGVRVTPLRDRDDLILANSEWCAEQLSQHFSISDAPVLYPPVMLPTVVRNSHRDPLGFVCLGRVVPEKEIERIISILKSVRELGYPVTLRLLGALDDSDYSSRVAALVAEESWIQPEGFLQLNEKQDVLSSMSFALHACRIEAFGIAVAEMASMGCIPFVPDTGGAGEIVSLPELQFGCDDEAVEKIVALLENPERTGEIRNLLPQEMNRFGPDVFMREIRNYVLDFSGRRNRSVDATIEQNPAKVS